MSRKRTADEAIDLTDDGDAPDAAAAAAAPQAAVLPLKRLRKQTALPVGVVPLKDHDSDDVVLNSGESDGGDSGSDFAEGGAGGGGASDDDAADLEGLEREPADADGDDDDYMDVGGGAKKSAAKGKAGGKGGRGRGGARGGARGGRGGRGAAKPRRRPQLGEDTWVDEDEVEEEPEEDEGRGGAFSVSNRDFGHDYSNMVLKPDHENRPLWICPDGRIFLESFSPVYKQACDFLIAVAEPVCRPECMHEYALTAHSLYAAVSVGLGAAQILSVLARLSKTLLPPAIEAFVRASTQNYGKVKLVLQRNRFFLESAFPEVLQTLLDDDVVAAARVHAPPPPPPSSSSAAPTAAAAAAAASTQASGFTLSVAPKEHAAAELAGDDAPADDEDRQLHSFEIDAAQVELVKQRCLPDGLNLPTLEEYDFRADTVNPDVPGLELKPATCVRPYQDKSLSKMFGNGRARSGIIVLPCGAGKSLTGIAAAARIKKSVLVLCTSSVSVDQWRYQFKLWTQLPDAAVVRFTSQLKEALPDGVGGVVVSTYNMIAFKGHRSEESEKILSSIRNREWGLMLLDEVHVVPAAMFRKVVGITKAHCKLGLTATLVREDERIEHLNFLIGPKLYEANWLDLQRGGFIANVQCAEVWCPMTKEFYREYLKPENSSRRQALYVMNPAKFRACQFLVQYHEQSRNDKIIVFSDNIFALREYAARLKRPFLYGDTSHGERSRVLQAFKNSSSVNTILLSKVGDNSIDIPEANVIIQISSHAGSRRQEAQRLGRILRPKARPPGAPPPTGAEPFNAFFYSLVSTDTLEMFYSTKRQQFLVDQGYAFHVVPQLVNPSEPHPTLGLSTLDEQLLLLAKVLAAGEEEAGEERLAADADHLEPAAPAAGGSGGAGGVTRRVRDVKELTGAAGGMRYAEFGSARGGAAAGAGAGRGRGRGRAPAAPKPPPRAHHSLLKDRFAQRK